MPQCVFKSCKNNSRYIKVSDGLSYFRFPGDPFYCAKWTSIVSEERQDKLFKPKKNSVVCSSHFEESYITGNSQRRRLNKTAIPKLQVLPHSENVTASVSEIDPLSNLEIEIYPTSQNDVNKEELVYVEKIPHVKIEPLTSVSEIPIVSNLENHPTSQNDVNKEKPVHEEMILNVKIEPSTSVSDIPLVPNLEIYSTSHNYVIKIEPEYEEKIPDLKIDPSASVSEIPLVSNLEIYPSAQNDVIEEEPVCDEKIPNLKIKPSASVSEIPLLSNLEIYPSAQNDVIEEDSVLEEKIPLNIVHSAPSKKASLRSSSTFSDLVSLCETPREIFLMRKLDSARKIIIEKTKKIHNLQKVNNRLVKKKNYLKSMIQLLRKKQKIDKKTVLLDLADNVEVADVFKGLFFKQKKHLKKPFSKYPPGAKKFALTLHSHSPAAYNYVRKMFNKCLPHPNTLYEWYQAEKTKAQIEINTI